MPFNTISVDYRKDHSIDEIQDNLHIQPRRRHNAYNVYFLFYTCTKPALMVVNSFAGFGWFHCLNRLFIFHSHFKLFYSMNKSCLDVILWLMNRSNITLCRFGRMLSVRENESMTNIYQQILLLLMHTKLNLLNWNVKLCLHKYTRTHTTHVNKM